MMQPGSFVASFQNDYTPQEHVNILRNQPSETHVISDESTKSINQPHVQNVSSL